MASTGKLVTVLVLVTGSAAFRSQRVSARQGQVDALVTFGAPSVSEPGLKNRRGENPCFPGQRLWTYDGDKVDAVVQLSYGAGFSHPQMNGIGLNRNRAETQYEDCAPWLTDFPTGDGDINFHRSASYLEAVAVNAKEFLNMSTISLTSSYLQDSEEVAEMVKMFGWRLAGTAFDRGSFFGGPQVSHLVQHPTSLDCIITFQGTNDWRQWITNFNSRKDSFCGLPELVHQGFRNHLRRIISSTGWQNEIRPHMSHCAKISITGHSLGGAMGSLFAACAHFAPQSGPGVEDYHLIGWITGEPKQLPYKG